MLVRTYMSTQIVTVEPDASILDGLRLFNLHRVHHLCVVRDGQLCGVVSDRDVLLALPEPDSDSRGSIAGQMTVDAVMTRDPLVAHPEMSMDVAAETLWRFSINCMPVVEAASLVGVLTTRDCLRALAALMPRLRVSA